VGWRRLIRHLDVPPSSFARYTARRFDILGFKANFDTGGSGNSSFGHLQLRSKEAQFKLALARVPKPSMWVLGKNRKPLLASAKYKPERVANYRDGVCDQEDSK
jgi:hypothetical protein